GVLTMTEVIAAVSKSLNVDADTIRRGRGGAARMLCAWIACHEGQVRLREIAASLHLRSTGRVSTLIGTCDRALDRDESLRACADHSFELLARRPMVASA
ncbi:MAG: hypothetical protein ABIO78_03175, partial [Thermoanaerobaculia bacterium]